MDRLLIAYLLIVGIALAVGLGVAFKLYHSRERTHGRRKCRDPACYERRMAERMLPPAPRPARSYGEAREPDRVAD